MPSWLRITLAAFATYRVAQLVTLDEGPFSIFENLRTAAGVYDRGPNGEPISIQGRMFGCPYCIGLYVALPGGILAMRQSLIGDAILLWLGLAGIAAYLQGPRVAP